ncbi:site-2 protease family protein [bacterium]|nr:site-2 protease family protein [bacterium]MCK4326097.1 site-2 protease family protein [bacterium]MCK4436773.1 site-2 protease family protein [bacterium]
MGLSQLVIWIPAFLLAIAFHECCHAWMADRLGDPTARSQGRITLNPIAHLDPIGTVLIPLLIIITGGGFLIGWAKPVPVNPYNLRHIKRDYMLVSLAGPASNVASAVIFAFLFHMAVLVSKAIHLPGAIWEPVRHFLIVAVHLNLILAFFNLIPVPPLDGSGILQGLLPDKYEEMFSRIRPFGFIILIALLMMGALNIVWFMASNLSIFLLGGG